MEERLIGSKTSEQAGGELVHIEVSLFCSQIKFWALTSDLLAKIARGQYLLVDVDSTDVIEIFEAENIDIPVKAINENKPVLNY